MEREQIIRMAREAGAAVGTVMPDGPEIIFPQCMDVERFAALVAAAERRACAKVCDDTGAGLWAVYKGRSKDDLLKRGRGSEYVQGAADQSDLLAAAIRARGQE